MIYKMIDPKKNMDIKDDAVDFVDKKIDNCDENDVNNSEDWSRGREIGVTINFWTTKYKKKKVEIENLQTIILTECDIQELDKLRIIILQLAKNSDLINFKHLLSSQIHEEKSEVILETENDIIKTEEDFFEFDALNKNNYFSDKQKEGEITSEMLNEENCKNPIKTFNKNKIKKGKHKCEYCSKRFRFSTSLEKHEQKHQENNYFIEEDENQEKENKQQNKKRKVSNYVKTEKGLYSCERCGCEFKTIGALERHIIKHDLASKVPPSKAEIEDGSGFKMIDLTEGNIVRCIRCELAFKSIGLYKMHMAKFHKDDFFCEVCHKRFSLPNTLIKHRLNYHTNFPVKCPDCDMVLTTKQLFLDHVNTQHSTSLQENKIECHICKRLVKNKYILKQHINLVHENKKGEFACDLCGKVLKSKASFAYHKRTHSGEFSYKCSDCGKGHKRYDKMMECLAQHQGIHKFQCPDCDYKSNQIGYYKKHLTTHSDAKPFSCPICKQNSSTSTNLNGHCKKVHKITLCQAEGMMKKNRFGKQMTEEELEQNRITLSRSEKLPGEPSSVLLQPKRKPKSTNMHRNNSNEGLSKAYDQLKSTTLQNPWNQQLTLQQQHSKQQLVANTLIQHQQLTKQDSHHPLFSRTVDYQLSRPIDQHLPK